ncbi:unnamed protein product [Symbiodinium sp. KB8]|nr:unnamed protein product [Symbiodinium sp. KB8]
MNACGVDLREREDRSDRVEDLSQPSSSRSSDSNYLDQESKVRRPIRPPRPALLGRAPEEPRHPGSLRADVAEEHVSISLRGNWGSKAPKAQLQPETWGKRQADSRAKGVVGALSNVVQEQLQMKYGLAIEVDDFTRKVESLCRAQSLGGLNEALDPCDVVSSLNNLKDMRFRTRDGKRSLALQLEPHVLETFEELSSEVSVMMGTACAIASVYRLHSWRAVAVFRQDYARPGALVGRCSVFTEPLISFTAQDFRSAVMLGITVTEVLKVHEPGVEVEPVPGLRDEYLSLRRSMAQAVQFGNPPAAPSSPLEKAQVPRRSSCDNAGIADFSRHGLGDALLERRAAEASQPSVMSMAMDWLWSRGQSTWTSEAQAPARQHRSGASAPPSSRRDSHRMAEPLKLDIRKGQGLPRKAMAGLGPSRQPLRSSSRPSARAEFETPAPLTMAGLGPATLSRADSPETPPAARMRRQQEAVVVENGTAGMVLSLPETDDANHRRDSRTSLNWGFCS